MLSKKSKTVKKTKQTQKVITQENHPIAVHPIQLPVVTAQPQKKTSFSRIIMTILLLIALFFIWKFFFFKAFDIYNKGQERISYKPKAIVHTIKRNPNAVAIVGNDEITLDQVKAFVAEVPQLAEVPFEQVYPNILEMLINDKVVANGAKRYGFPKNPQIQKMIKVATDQIIAQAYFAKELERTLTEEDLKQVYEEEVKNFKPQEEIHARHILLPTEKQASDVLIQLKAGADFGLLADQKSIDKNAPKGDLGYFTKEMMIPEFADAVFSMKKGQLSEPVHTAYGWHIILVEDRRSTQPPAFELVKEQMRQLATERKIPEILSAERARQNVQILRPTLVVPEKNVSEPETGKQN